MNKRMRKDNYRIPSAHPRIHAYTHIRIHGFFREENVAEED